MSAVHDWRERTMAPLRLPDFRRLWLASIIANFGTVTQLTAAAWAMTELTRSPALIALVQSCAMAPMVLFALPAGALADTINRRFLMLAAQSLGLIATIALAALSLAGSLSPAPLLIFTLVIGAATALYVPAWQASFGELAPRELLPAVVGVNALSFNLARSAGPALAGALIAAAGVAAGFVLNAFSHITLLAALLAWRPRAQASTLPAEPFAEAMVSGLRYIVFSPATLKLLLRGASFGFGASIILALTPLLARNVLDGGAAGYGALLASFGAGALVAALTLTWLRQKLSGARLVTLASIAAAIATIGLGLATSLVAAGLCTFVSGACWIYALTTIMVSLQLFSPRWIVGRAMAAGYTATAGGAALGAAVWGLLGEFAGPQTALLTAGAYLVLTLLLDRLASVPADAAVDPSPAPRPILAPKLPLDAGAGPIVVLIEYRVQADRAQAFVDAIQRFGRIRRRNGATRWSIARDVDDPELWIERIESASWSAFERRVSHATTQDQLAREAVLELCLCQPRVRRLIERAVAAPAPIGETQ